MVRLGGCVVIFHFKLIINFNSSMVRLGVNCRSPRLPAAANFNSSMVRLGVMLNPNVLGAGMPFQFQYGTIGGAQAYGTLPGYCNFNSSMVRLGDAPWVVVVRPLPNFNSSMVRLGVFAGRYVEAAPVFQFQYGTIGGNAFNWLWKSFTKFQFQYGTIGGAATPFLVTALVRFQFQYGTIGGRRHRLERHGSFPISIPVWYDWGECTVKH